VQLLTYVSDIAIDSRIRPRPDEPESTADALPGGFDVSRRIAWFLADGYRIVELELQIEHYTDEMLHSWADMLLN
jgi:hypothetical protein